MLTLADAWDEGFDAGERDAMNQAHFIENTNCVPNPYRPEGGES